MNARIEDYLLENKAARLHKIYSLLNSREQEFMTTILKILINISQNEKIRKALRRTDALKTAVSMISANDATLKSLAAKWLINLSVSGFYRKAIHEQGYKSFIETQINSSPENVKEQLRILLNNLAFPYDNNYEDTDFEESMLLKLEVDAEEKRKDEEIKAKKH